MLDIVNDDGTFNSASGPKPLPKNKQNKKPKKDKPSKKQRDRR